MGLARDEERVTLGGYLLLVTAVRGGLAVGEVGCGLAAVDGTHAFPGILPSRARARRGRGVVNSGLAARNSGRARPAAGRRGIGLIRDVEPGSVADGVAFDGLEVLIPLVVGIADGPQDDLQPLVATGPRPDGMQHQARPEQQVEHHRQGLQVEHVLQPRGHLPLTGLALLALLASLLLGGGHALDRPVLVEMVRGVLEQQALHEVQDRVDLTGDTARCARPEDPRAEYVQVFLVQLERVCRHGQQLIGCRGRRDERQQGHHAVAIRPRPHLPHQARPPEWRRRGRLLPGLQRIPGGLRLLRRAAADGHDDVGGVRRPGRGTAGIGRGPLQAQVADPVLDLDDGAGVLQLAVGREILAPDGHGDPPDHVGGCLQVVPPPLREPARGLGQVPGPGGGAVLAMAVGERQILRVARIAEEPAQARQADVEAIQDGLAVR